MITIFDIFKYGADYILPSDPVSLYRYVEHLIEITVLRKYSFKNILEIGPGTDPVFKYLKKNDFNRGALADYNPHVLEFCRQLLSNEKIDDINIDFTDKKQVNMLGSNWDYIVCNSILEHLEDDAAFVENMRSILKDRGIIVCSTVLHKWLYNEWDHGVGHHRRYSIHELKNLFANYSQVTIIRTSLVQELVRPLFFSRLKHLQMNTIEENNKLFAEGGGI